ncbi:Gfo/Idh/MocA family protein [Porphyromonas sp. COT-290 OH860]|uniref:Gfo/Idh/MocA family protein n=1 Tax=Porphyromonas sp. COT-290 OH860 TaxID=1515615 RepID=UPI00052E27E8|nr:Gfo/Idh/MocA family oxidoreductase [Porphyromonas sp. COT-290 OH860]KGN82248.1 oxidoreductase [Porphyromonas sp. COT-290 OH860]
MPSHTIRTAIIGLGYRGSYLLQLLQTIGLYEVVAVADPSASIALCPSAKVYNQSGEDYRRMLEEQEIDLVFIASPWKIQMQQAEDCLHAGVHLALEIKGGLHQGEYDEVIRLSRAKGLRVYPLENTLFMREIMALQQMVLAGILGEIIHLRGGYRHDLRTLLMPEGADEHWRTGYYHRVNGDLYPTHGLAPLCFIAGIGRHDRPLHLTAVASRARGLELYAQQTNRGDIEPVATGDIISTQITTASGVLISLTHDTTLPRPKSLDYEVQGTKGIWQGDGRRIYLEGISPRQTWESDGPYIEQYLHPCWHIWGEEALRQDKHHQGMDYMMLRVLGADLLGEATYPADIKDLAFWCSITPLSALSIAQRGSVDFPNT